MNLQFYQCVLPCSVKASAFHRKAAAFGGGRPVGDPDVFRKKMNNDGTNYGGSTNTNSISMVWAGWNKKHAGQKLRYGKVRSSAHLNPT